MNDMTTQLYKVYLDDQLLGTTQLDKADPPMGVVTGRIEFINLDAPYQFFNEYCLTNDIQITSDDSEFRLICTGIIDRMHVYNSNDIEIKGIAGNYIEGMEKDDEGFSITILGIDHRMFESEFPHHYEQDDQNFK